MSESNEATNSGAEPAMAPPAPSPEPSQPSVSQPPALREDMLQSAVAFLTHPKVKDSPEATKRSFLERKGLTTAEVDEAFKRAPSPPPSSTPSAAPTTQPVQSPSGLVTYQTQPQHSQPQPYSTPAPPQQGTAIAAPPDYSLVPGLPQQGGVLVPAQPQPQPQPQPVQEPVRWSQVVLGIGVLATGIYAVKCLVYPYVRDAYCSWSERSRAQREAQEQQQRALSELILTMNACKDELSGNSKRMEQLLEMLQAQHAEQAAANRRAESSNLDLTQELASMRTALLQLQHSTPRHPTPPPHAPLSASAYNNATGVSSHRNQPHNTSPWAPPSTQASTSSSYHPWSPAGPAGSLAPAGANPTPINQQPAYSHQFLSPSSSPSDSPRATATTRAPPPPHPRTLAGGASPPQRPFPGGSEDILPPPGGFIGGYPAGAGVMQGAPWQPPQAQQQLQQQAESVRGPAPWQQQQAESVQGPGPAGAAGAAAKAPYPPSFMEVMDMVAKGITPPNVRTDIDDKPPDPFRPPSEPRLAPRSKPWEAALAAKPPSPFPPPISPTTALPHAPSPSLTSIPAPAATPAAAAAAAGNGGGVNFRGIPAPTATPPGSTLSPSPLSPYTAPIRGGVAPPPASTSGTQAAGLGGPADDGSSLLMSSRDWLGAAGDAEVVRQQQLPPPERAGEGQPTQQFLQYASGTGKGRGLNAAAEPYAPAWLQQQQQQPVSASPVMNPIFQGLQRELAGGSVGGQPSHEGTQLGVSAEDRLAGSTPEAQQQQQQQVEPPPPPPPRPISVLQPNPAWKPPPPPKASVTRPPKPNPPQPSTQPLTPPPPPPPTHSTAAPQANGSTTPAHTPENPSQPPPTTNPTEHTHPAPPQHGAPQPTTHHTPPHSATSPPTASQSAPRPTAGSPAPESSGAPKAVHNADAAGAPAVATDSADGADGVGGAHAPGLNGGEAATAASPGLGEGELSNGA